MTTSTEHIRPSPWLHPYFQRYRTRTPPDLKGLRVLFLVESPTISGGSNVILQHALYAYDRGANVRIATIVGDDVSSGDPPWHPTLASIPIESANDCVNDEYDIVIATFWTTVYQIPRFRYRHATYLVQAVESLFHATDPDESASMLAEATYTLGIPMITISTWLQTYLTFRYQAPSVLVLNGIDKQAFSPKGRVLVPREGDRVRVLVEGSLNAPRKGVLETIEVARASGCSEVWYLGHATDQVVDSVDRCISGVPITQVGEILRSCDVLLKMSHTEGMYGPPLEMFHCGGTVVTYDVPGSEEYVRHLANGLITPIDDPSSALTALNALVDSPVLLARLKEGALETAAGWHSWPSASARFWTVLKTVNGLEKANAFELNRNIIGTHAAISGMMAP